MLSFCTADDGERETRGFFAGRRTKNSRLNHYLCSARVSGTSAVFPDGGARVKLFYPAVALDHNRNEKKPTPVLSLSRTATNGRFF